MFRNYWLIGSQSRGMWLLNTEDLKRDSCCPSWILQQLMLLQLDLDSPLRKRFSQMMWIFRRSLNILKSISLTLSLANSRLAVSGATWDYVAYMLQIKLIVVAYHSISLSYLSFIFNYSDIGPKSRFPRQCLFPSNPPWPFLFDPYPVDPRSSNIDIPSDRFTIHHNLLADDRPYWIDETETLNAQQATRRVSLVPRCHQNINTMPM